VLLKIIFQSTPTVLYHNGETQISTLAKCLVFSTDFVIYFVSQLAFATKFTGYVT